MMITKVHTEGEHILYKITGELLRLDIDYKADKKVHLASSIDKATEYVRYYSIYTETIEHNFIQIGMVFCFENISESTIYKIREIYSNEVAVDEFSVIIQYMNIVTGETRYDEMSIFLKQRIKIIQYEN